VTPELHVQKTRPPPYLVQAEHGAHHNLTTRNRVLKALDVQLRPRLSRAPPDFSVRKILRRVSGAQTVHGAHHNLTTRNPVLKALDVQLRPRLSRAPPDFSVRRIPRRVSGAQTVHGVQKTLRIRQLVLQPIDVRPLRSESCALLGFTALKIPHQGSIARRASSATSAQRTPLHVPNFFIALQTRLCLLFAGIILLVRRTLHSVCDATMVSPMICRADFVPSVAHVASRREHRSA